MKTLISLKQKLIYLIIGVVLLSITACELSGEPTTSSSGSEDNTLGVATPVAEPPAGPVASGTVVKLSTVTKNADIYYTTDNSTPTTSSTKYTGPITITAPVTIKAIGARTGVNNSNVLIAAYTIGVQSIKITTLPAKTSYLIGESFNSTGMVVSLIGIDGTSTPVTGYTISGFSSAAPGGIKTVTVIYQGMSASFDVMVYASTPVAKIEMIWIPAGSFQMGSPSTELGRYAFETPHQVTLSKGFYMGKYEVTQKQWVDVMGSNISSSQSGPAAGEIQNQRPVENLSWYNALVFCNKLSISEGLSPVYSISGSTNPANWPSMPAAPNTDATWDAVVMIDGANGYRLPTDAQWEYACRAGTTTAFNDGITDNWALVPSDTTLGWFSTNSGSKTHQVGLKAPNKWGLYDMHGNVSEWCWDRWSTPSTSPATDPTGPTTGNGRIQRGGSFNETAQTARSAARFNSGQNSVGSSLGLRLLRSE
ncbi:MAG: SUMF1/EgtB/PvdO family nonheme iron enzyme [Treponema sp.]|nr:SUMF1/EgtB/PvdO family nonheme iron enzyme [Treponema sp.]